MLSFRERLVRGDRLLCDGAIGTRLIAAGVAIGECPELINVERPALLTEIAQSYVEAGADLITTNTFGASPLKLAHYRIEDRLEELNRTAVEIVAAVAAGKAYVAASVGPTAKILEPYGDADPEVVRDGFVAQIDTLVSAGADLVLIETMTAIEEARLAVEAARQVSADIPVGVTMTFDQTPRGFFTIMGVTVEQACGELVAAGADFVGSNCGNGSEVMSEVAQAFVEHATVPVIIQSNAGLPELTAGEISYAEGPEKMAGQVERMIALGVQIVGGCCGTTAEHIAAMRAVLPSS